MARSVKKITLSLPSDLADQTTYLASRFGVSRSALVSELLTEPVALFYGLVSTIPENPSPEDAIRYRGSAADILRAKIEEMQNATIDLFGGATK